MTTVQALVLLSPRIQLAIARTIRLLPDNSSLRLYFLNHFHYLGTEYSGKVIHLLSGFHEYLKVSNDEKALNPWHIAGLDEQFNGRPSAFLIEQIQPGSRISEVFQILARIHHCQSLGLNVQEVKNLWALLKLGLSADRTVHVALLFRQTRWSTGSNANLLNYDFLYDIPDVRLQFARKWAPDDTDMFVKLVRALVDHQEDFVRNYLVPTYSAFQESGQSELFLKLVVEGYWKTPRYGNPQLPFLHKVSKNDLLSFGLTITRKHQIWMRHYPESFRETLGKFASIESEAEKIASTILSTDFPNPQKIRQ